MNKQMQQTTGNGRAQERNGVAHALDTQIEHVTGAWLAQIVRQMTNMAPTLIAGFGGGGHEIAANCKAKLVARFGRHWSDRIQIRVFDTVHEPVSVMVAGAPVALEAGVEIFEVGQVPLANVVRNLENLDVINERLGSVLSNLPPTVLRHGARQTRPLGTAAFLWHYELIRNQLRQALWRLAGRDLVDELDAGATAQGLHVIIVNSLAGGTGAGMFLDGAILIRSLLEELGNADFCQITGVFLLPRAFPGIPAEGLQANTGAALEELNHLMTRSGFRTRYPDGRKIVLHRPLFDKIHLLDGVTERGHTLRGLNEVADIAAEGIYLQIASAVGHKNASSLTNHDQVLMGQNAGGEGTFLSSFGIGAITFPAHEVVAVCTQRLLAQAARQAWLATPEEASLLAEARQQLQAVAAAQLAAELRRDERSGGELRAELHPPAWLLETDHAELAAAAAHYVREFGHARINEEVLVQIQRNSQAILQAQITIWTAWVNQIAGNNLLRQTAVLQEAHRQLERWANAASQELNGLEKTGGQQKQAVAHLESSIAQAANSFILGRDGRVREAVNRYFQAAQALFANQVHQALLRAQAHVWRSLDHHLTGLAQSVQALSERLAQAAAQLEAAEETTLERLARGGVSQLSLADRDYVLALYHRHAPAQVSLAILLEQSQTNLLALTELGTEALVAWLTQELRTPFAPIAAKSVENALQERVDGLTPQAWRQRLFRLATPTWSIDRTRLPDAGAGLHRQEVLGVPDEKDTLFAGEPGLVSIHDPHRLAAMVMVIGAPASALQQHERFRQSVERMRRQRPLYVLPQFIADAGHNKLAFALGSIFGLIANQGTYFYYQPGDPLAPARRLGNGLANAISAIGAQNDLAREILERVDGRIAQQGLQQAIQRLATYYEDGGAGRQPGDTLTLELKRLVRDYVAELQQIDELSQGLR